MSLPLPYFFEHDPSGELLPEDAARISGAADRYRHEHNIQSASEDKFRVAAFGIDCQITFCDPRASLYVPGAEADVHRSTEWIYFNADKITQLVFSLDTHSLFQIFHPAAWFDPQGNHPAPFGVIRAGDVREGRWIPSLPGCTFPDLKAACVEYCEKLEASGRYVLTIWPYHALLGGISHALMPELMDAAIFHSALRRTEARIKLKGRSPYTENFSVLSPEVTELKGQKVGGFDTALFDALMSYDRVYVFGEAKSHCVLSTLRDLMEECRRRDPSLLRKIWILEDAMSSVPPPPLKPLPPELNFPEVANRAMMEFREAGMRMVKTTEPIAL